MSDTFENSGYFTSDVDLDQGMVVALAVTEGKIKKAATTDDCLAIVGASVKAGEAVQLRTAEGQVVKVLAGAAFALGAKLMGDAGKAKTAATSGKIVIGRAMQAATAVDELVLALIEKTVLP